MLHVFNRYIMFSSDSSCVQLMAHVFNWWFRYSTDVINRHLMYSCDASCVQLMVNVLNWWFMYSTDGKRYSTLASGFYYIFNVCCTHLRWLWPKWDFIFQSPSLDTKLVFTNSLPLQSARITPTDLFYLFVGHFNLWDFTGIAILQVQNMKWCFKK